MKKMIMTITGCFIGWTMSAQENKIPITVHDSPTQFNVSANLYHDYGDQGNRMYINNSHFQNKDNSLINSVPISNGQYIPPGNSNPINQNMNQPEPLPSGNIYSGDILIRSYGTRENQR
ncbi:MAG TPA: hypothetical protein PL009_07575 [Flavipsychrobacter sp.]|nr:hypothetical protein [Flavipsychrobacter sp.]